MLVIEHSNVQSSVYAISLISSSGSSNRDMYRLNNVVDNTPCGTSCLTLLYLELIFLNVTYVYLPTDSFKAIFLLCCAVHSPETLLMLPLIEDVQ